MPPLSAESPLAHLIAQFPRAGHLQWIGLRPARDVAMREVDDGRGDRPGRGLSGDRFKGGSGKRGVTLLQAEHLPVIAALAGKADIPPATVASQPAWYRAFHWSR